jgi:hypothetical protein
MKLLKWIDTNLLLLLTLVLLAVIPLYPKVPLLSLTYTWVSIRWDDVLVALTVLFYFVQLIRGKATWKLPVSYAVFTYWVVGLTATILGVIFIFPHYPLLFTNMPSVYVRNAALFFLRHIEYMLLLFVAFSTIKNKKQIHSIIITLVITLTLVIIYGLGQRFFPIYFPAFSTMNEEFAKGFVLYLNATDRLESTFAGHYDLAAYMALMIPLVGSLVFGYKRWSIKILLLVISVLGILILLWTSSRTSFIAYLIAICFMLVLQKQKKWIIPVVLVSVLLLFSFQSVWTRYASTVKPVRVAVDSNGNLLGIVKNANGHDIIDQTTIPGANLPAGTLRVGNKTKVGELNGISVETLKSGSNTAIMSRIKGNITIQQTQTLDISLTTRLQAEWPNAIKAWLRDPLFGSGFSSVGLATDGNYFRILAETGILGMIAFLSIFFFYGKYVWRNLSKVDSPVVRSFILGVSAGIVGIAINASLIDIFEASKVAYTLWLLMGISLGLLHLYARTTHK